jgi:GDSL-like Lipase/Acylhydrolase family
MTPSLANEIEQTDEAKLPRRDLWLLPLLSLLTIAVCLVGAEVIARHLFSAGGVAGECLVTDAKIGWRYRSDCSREEKNPEGPWVTQHWNACGYRTHEPCGPKPPGTTRIALVGSSTGEGIFIPYDEAFATRTAATLTQVLGRPVEVQNLSRTACYPLCSFRMVDEALALKPDVLVMITDPFDIEHLNPAEMGRRYQPMGTEEVMAEVRNGDAGAASRRDLVKRLKGWMNETRMGFAAQHYMFQDTSLYARIYLHYGDRADYLRVPFAPAWEKRFEAFEVLVDEIAQKARVAHIPFVILVQPSLAQASLLKMQEVPPGVDPYAFNQRLRQIAERHGVQFADPLDLFNDQSNISKLYYIVDTHPNGAGHALLAQALVRQLLKEDRSVMTSDDKQLSRQDVLIRH